MASITEQADQLAMLMGAAHIDDLPALARVHDALEALDQVLAEATTVPMDLTRCLGETGADAKRLVEGIILHDVADLDQALIKLTGQITRIGRLVSGEEKAPALPDGCNAASVVLNPAPVVAAAAFVETVIAPDDVPMIREFVGEANGHLEEAEHNLLELEQRPDDKDAVGAVFRAFHTIKGVAGFLNLKQIGALAHAAENLLDMAREGRLQIAGPVADVVLESSDMMKHLVGDLDEAVNRSAPPEICTTLPDLIHRLHAVADGSAAPASASPAVHGARDIPVALVTPAVVAAAEAEAAIAPVAPPDRRGDDRRVGDRRETDRRAPDRTAAAAADSLVKVSTERLDNLINMIGELVIAQSMVSQDVGAAAISGDNQRLLRNLSHLAKLTRELQDLSMAMRMVPIQGTFQKMSRLVRDLASKSGKQVELIINDGDTELDRNVVDAISDPLIHMVRNSVDHGIEQPEDRVKAGKSPIGRVELHAEHKAGNIVIEIRDDGRGLNKERILRKAIDAGIAREGQDLTEPEILKLIFHAGLSTAERVTDISGRGVGMDVVKRNVEALHGRIEITTLPGQGATFTIRLPLTLAVIDGLLVKVGKERYILPILSVEQSIRPTKEQLSSINGRGEVVMVRGGLLPLFRLHRIFGVAPRSEDPTRALVVIVRDNDRQCCLLVDELLGQQQVVIKSLGDGIGNVPGVSGGAILGDGSVSLILDVPGLIDLAGRM